MEPKSNYSKLMAAVYLVMSYLAALVVLELVCFLTFYPLLEGHRGWQLFCSIVWLYAGTYVFYRLTRRYTKWWKKLEGRKNG
ncbi:hypothetical protein QUW17_08075 [Bacteroides gallinaceum]|uniref:Uncharacterized protein n=1 Tax=Candidatus Phocaeicola excrementipullorum TaxID=2838731 RepID=A0A948X1J1_9BACT|nr:MULTISPECIES: hypothetical protein [Bacteroides]MBU3855119.1 hypothetical protein [Candidatus Phocaeicola excrementipullorum]MCR8916815.1 hypothetical protein [Bacteroides sp. ET225]MDM8207833.1 hypothetical protein [Bacteroides gallinaceum]